jgi:WD40 repeat protein
MDFSPDGKTLAIGLGGAIAFWSPEGKGPGRRCELPDSYGADFSRAGPAFSPNGKKVAVGFNRVLQVLDVATGKPVVSWPSYDGRFCDLAFSADGRILFADLFSGSDLAIDTATWRQRKAPKDSLRQFEWVQAVSRDGTLCVASDGKEDALFDVKTGRMLARLQAREPSDRSGFFSPKSRYYVMQDLFCDGKTVDTVYAIPQGKRLWQLSFFSRKGVVNGTCCWTFSANESRLAFFDRTNETIHVRDAVTGKLLSQFGKYRGPVVPALAPNGDMLAAWVSGRRDVLIWDLRTGKQQHSLVLKQEAKENDRACLLWSADSRLLAVGGLDNSVRLWEVASGQVRREFRGHEARATHLAFSPNGQVLATGSDDTTLLIWKTHSDK